MERTGGSVILSETEKLNAKGVVQKANTLTNKFYGIWAKQLEKLEFETPFTALDLKIIKNNVGLLNKLLPDVDIYYATKSNSDDRLINCLESLVKGFEIASAGELSLLRSLGVESQRIIYSNPVKVPAHIRAAHDEGVQYYAFDSLDEVKKIAELAPGAKVYLRLKVADFGSKFPLSKKFGIDPAKAIAYIKSAARAGLQPIGLTFHVGSQSENAEAWVRAMTTCGQIIDELATRHNIFLSLLNIGGGLPSSYSFKALSLKSIALAIEEAIEQFIPVYTHVIAEPGRFISANSSVIVTEVIGRETRGAQEWLFLDMGVFQGLIEPLEMPSWRYPIFTDQQNQNVAKKSFVLTGPTCDPHDTIGFDYLLPEDLEVGDRLYIGAAGAYTSVYKTEFNGFKPPKTYYIEHV